MVLVGLIGGLRSGSLAAARRTQSSFSTFLASTNPSDLSVAVYSGGGPLLETGGPVPCRARAWLPLECDRGWQMGKGGYPDLQGFVLAPRGAGPL